MKQLHIITDLQFGSTGKGLFAGYLAGSIHPDTIITAWAPNAGHTFRDAAGKSYVTSALPSGIFNAPDLKRILLGPGSVINAMLLLDEMDRFAKFLHDVTISIHPAAACVTDVHRRLEAIGPLSKIGSTLKGVSEAMIQKMRRGIEGSNIAGVALMGTPLEGNLVTTEDYDWMVDEAEVCIIEGAQGFSLSINHGFYPFVTSRDCTTTQILTDCGIPSQIWDDISVYGVARVFPIRVNNRDGWSGPCYPDQREVHWDEIGVPAELTTVTKLPRRIFTFSEEQIRRAIRMNGTDRIFLNFANYCDLPVTGQPGLKDIINIINKYAPVHWLGYGPAVTDIVSHNAFFGGEPGMFSGINS